MQAQCYICPHCFDDHIYGPCKPENLIRRLDEVRAALQKAGEALRLCFDELKDISKDEACDHEVNICWCSVFKALDCAKLYLDSCAGEKDNYGNEYFLLKEMAKEVDDMDQALLSERMVGIMSAIREQWDGGKVG